MSNIYDTKAGPYTKPAFSSGSAAAAGASTPIQTEVWELDLYEELKTETGAMGDALLDFLMMRVWGNHPIILEDGKTLAATKVPPISEYTREELIYAEYQTTGPGMVLQGSLQPSVDLKAIASIAKAHKVAGKAHLQGNADQEAVPLEDALKAWKPSYGGYFAVFFVDESKNATWRLYLNATPIAITSMFRKLCLYAETKTAGIHSFKVAGSSIFNSRVDKMVVYLHSQAFADQLRPKLVDGEQFKHGTPWMAKQYAKGVGGGEQAEKSHVSFGRLRAQAIAAAIDKFWRWMHDCNKPKLTGRVFPKFRAGSPYEIDGFEEFAKFVCAEFRRRNLDPMNPHLNVSTEAGSGPQTAAARIPRPATAAASK